MKNKAKYGIIFKTILSTLLVAVVFLGMSFTSYYKVSAKEITKDNIIESIVVYDTKEKNEKLFNLVSEHIAFAMKADTPRQIGEVKELYDFDGNTYTLFELKPTGYIIYHNDSATFFEYATNSISPYYSFYGNLFYGGMKQYYQKDNNKYVGVVLKDVTLTTEDLESLRLDSQEIAKRNNENKIKNNLAFLNDEISLNDVALYRQIADSKNEMDAITPASSPSISMANFFPRLTTQYNMGYHSGGVCGYIAANMILAYNAMAYDYFLVPSIYIDRANYTIKGSALTAKLIDYGGDSPNSDGKYPGTTAIKIRDVVHAFIGGESYNSYSWTSSWWIGIINSRGSIDANHPCILFGSLNRPDTGASVNHAVVAYGYTGNFWTGYTYRVHFGWSGYADVQLSLNAIGTTMTLRIS